MRYLFVHLYIKLAKVACNVVYAEKEKVIMNKRRRNQYCKQIRSFLKVAGQVNLVLWGKKEKKGKRDD